MKARKSQPAAVPVANGAGADEAELLRLLAGAGRITWSGGKPRGLRNPPEVGRHSAAAAVIEGRR